jgi:hypothetical protein
MAQMLLVIVIVAAVALLATMLFMRMTKAPHSGSTADVGQPAPTAAPAAAPPQQAERAAVTESPPPAPTSAPRPTDDLSSATLSFNAADLDFALMPTAQDVAAAPAAAAGPDIPEPATNTAANTADAAAVASGNATARLPSDPAPKGPRKLQASEVFTRLFDLALGKARPATSVNPGHQAVMDATAVALEDAATQQRYAPRRPNMLPRVLSASNDESFSRRELAALIAQDP